MWGLAAAFGPVGWVVAAVGTAATVYAATSSSDKYEISTYSDKDEKKSEAKETTKREKNNTIYQDIKAYKKMQVKRFKEKYNVDINFHGGTVNGKDLSEKISITKENEIDTITILEKETEEIIKLIEILELEKHETIN